MRGTLYIVATPVGNLKDITIRALETLEEVDLIAAEDTRHTRKLLTHYGISKPIISYYGPREEERARKVLERLREGLKVALVSDAGTPGISDPGYRVVRLAVEESIPVVPIPGPCAFIAALSASGLPTDSFHFAGFLPKKEKDRRLFLVRVRQEGGTFICYESPKRLLSTLKDMEEVLGNAEVVVARELTKVHEEFIRGRVSSILDALKGKEVKGEVVLILRVEKEVRTRSLTELIREYQGYGLAPKDLVRLVADELGIPRGMVYKEVLRLKGRG